jgi:hypothetical protein
MTVETTEKPQELVLQTPNDGSVPNIFQLARDFNEVFATGEEGELSFVRAMLRCLGHSAIGDSEKVEAFMDSDPNAEIPKVNPWKLAHSLGKSIVSKSHRRKMMTRIGEEMAIGDGLGLLAVVSLHDLGKRAGLSKEESRTQAWQWYGAPETKKN